MKIKTGLLILVGLALLLNGFGIAFDLPYVTHPDEPRIVRHAMAMGAGDLNPHFFISPTFWTYLVFLIQAVSAALGLFLGLIHSRLELWLWAFTDQSFYFIFPRLITAFLGAISVLLVFRMGQKFSEETGWVSAIVFLSFAPWVWQAHFATTDVPLTLLILCVILAAIQSLDSPKTSSKWLLIAACLAGLAISTKFNAVPVMGTVLVAWYLRRAKTKNERKQKIKLIWQMIGLSFLAFAVTSPYYFLAFQEAWQGLKFVLTDIAGTATVFDPWSYCKWLWQYAGPGILAIAGVGAWQLALARNRKPALIIAGFVLPYAILIQCSGYKAVRYLLPLWPFVALAFAWGWLYLKKQYFKKSAWLAYGLLVLALLPLCYQTFQTEKSFRTYSATRQASEWIKVHVSRDAHLWVDEKSQIQLLPARSVVESRRQMWLSESQDPRARQLYRVYGYYLQTPAPDRGYLLLPTQKLSVNNFNSGYVASDFSLTRLRSADYVVLVEERLDDDFGVYVQRHFRRVRAFSDGQRSIFIFERK